MIFCHRYIHGKLPKGKQCMAFSATFTEELLGLLQNVTSNPQVVRLTTDIPELEGEERESKNMG